MHRYLEIQSDLQRNELKVHSYFHKMSKLLNCNYHPKMQMCENQKSIFYHMCQSKSQIPNFMDFNQREF